MIRIRVVEPFEIPSTVRRERPDPVPARGEQLPELLRRLHPTRQPHAHPDDHDRIVAGHRGRRRLRSRRGRAKDLFPYVRSEPFRARMVEGQRRRQRQPRPSLKPVAQLHRGQRVEAQLLERPSGRDLRP